MQLSKTLSLPDDLAGRRTAVFGISGSGKSNTATVIIEELVTAGEQVILIDPKGEGWGLLSDADGKPSNLDLIVFGEPHGHIEQLTEAHGKELADFAAESNRSIVLSLLGFNSDQSERRFVASFLQQLYRRKSRQTRPTRALVIIEEAHLFVPEGKGQGFKGEMADLVGAVQRVARQGRSAGLGTLIIDQRPQDVAKRVISQCDTIVCHQLTHKLDRDALADWVRSFDTKGQGDQFLGSLSSLKPGEAWVWSPSAGIFQRGQVRRRKTFDSGASPDASVSDKPVQRAKVDLESLRSQLSELVEKAKADDPAELKKRIKELEKQLAAKSAGVSQVEVEAAQERAISFAVAMRDSAWKPVQDALLIASNHLAEIGKMVRIVETLPTGPEPMKVEHIPVSGRRSVPPRLIHRKNKPRPVDQKTKPARQSSPLGDFTPNKAQQRILDALAWWESMGVSAPSAIQVGAIALIDASGGHFSNLVGPLSTNGLIERGQGVLRLTETGAAVATAPDTIGTMEDYHQMIRERVRKSRNAGAATLRILDAIIFKHGDEITTGEIGELAGMDHTGGHFSNSIGPLSTLGLITRSQGVVRPTNLLFPEGL